MIQRANRFRGRKSINQVYQKGVSSNGSYFGLRILKASRPAGYRLAVVVSKKVSKSAVVRNRIRRQLYAQMRTIGPLINQPCDIVMSVYKVEIKDLPPSQTHNLLVNQLAKAGLTLRAN